MYLGLGSYYTLWILSMFNSSCDLHMAYEGTHPMDDNIQCFYPTVVYD